MQDFKKALLSSLAFILLFILISVIIIEPYVNSELYYYNDKNRRAQLAGSIDYGIIGASHALTSLVPSIIDEKLDCNSYNLSGSLMTWNCRSAIVNEEINRNPLDTLILEISYNSMVLSEKETESNIYTFPRLNSVSSRLGFIIQNQSLSEFDQFYADALNSGLTVWEGMLYKIYKSKGKDIVDIISTPYKRDLQYENKGFLARDKSDITLNKDEASALFGKEQLDVDFKDYNIQEMEKIINACNEKNIDVIIVVVPISDRFIWKYSGWDEFQAGIESIGAEYGCPVYDFNLLKDRYDLFSDETTFSDETHLSKEGAEIFTNYFCDVMNKGKSEELNPLFYTTYSEMISDSPYMQYITD